eukprot:TRINITY_DN15114_c0_g1_i3.p1 TRINITY_DN15114_c0_g1~~TRINITY_DN15114_c0_g1_i3.p1  ORF type:complete len:365 (+),score=100.97 TRINITY_DN15114_c0_g1_i3:84-1178(+)
MPRPSRTQRLRAQLAASQGEVRALREKMEMQEGLRNPSERLAAVHYRWLDAERRAGAAELKLLQYAEPEQRAAVVVDEKQERKALSSRNFFAVEAQGRAELAAAEEAARAELAAMQAACRKDLKRQREARRKNRQKQRKGKRGGRNSVQPTRLEEDSGITDEHTTAHSAVTRSSSASPPSSASLASSNKDLFVDNVCFWVAAFAPFSWAPVCSVTARAVLQVMKIYELGWRTVGFSIAHFQSMGRDHAPDLNWFGPDPGVVYCSYLRVQELKNKVVQLASRGLSRVCVHWFCRWLLHMDLQLNMYEAMRLRYKELFLAAKARVGVHLAVFESIEGALEAFDRRKALEAEGNADDDAARTSDAAA